MAPDYRFTLLVGRIIKGRPGEVGEVEGDDGRLQETRPRLTFLHFGDDADDAQGDAYDQICANEEFMKATAASSVVDVEENEAGEGEGKVEQCTADEAVVVAVAVLLLHSTHPVVGPVVREHDDQHELDEQEEEGSR